MVAVFRVLGWLPLGRGVNPGNGLLDLAVYRVAPEVRVVLFLLHPLSLGLLVAGAHVTGHGFTLLAGLRAFQCDYFAWHGVKS